MAAAGDGCTLQFVDQIAVTPTVRLDIDDEAAYTMSDDWDFSPPPIDRSVSENKFRDGAIVPTWVRRNRTITGSIFIKSATEDLLASGIQALARELGRDRNILKYISRGATKPVFFRTFASPDFEIDDGPYEPGCATVRVKIFAEPYALGLREDLGPYTVYNDLAHAGNGLYVDIPAALGDVEALPIIFIPTSGNGKQLVIGTRRRGTVTDLVVGQQAESFSASTDTSVQANDAAMSGSGNNFMRTTFATNAAMVDRIASGALFMSNTPDADLFGVYRVFARLRRSSAVGTIKVRLKLYDGGGNTLFLSDPVTVQESAGPFWVDLGLVQNPPRPMPEEIGASGVVSKPSSINVAWQAQRVSGTSNLDWDKFAYLPADDRLYTASYDLTDSSDHYIDGIQNMFLAATDYVGVNSEVGSGIELNGIGGVPVLSQLQTTRLVILNSRAIDEDNKNDSMALSLYYWPRYLNLRFS